MYDGPIWRIYEINYSYFHLGTLLTTCAYASESPSADYASTETQRILSLQGTGAKFESIKVLSDDSVLLTMPQLIPESGSFYPVSGTRNPPYSAYIICGHFGYQGSRILSYKALESKVEAADMMMMLLGYMHLTVFKTNKIVDQVECFDRQSQ